jgi:ATP-dependent Lhr-like helicase
MTADQIFAKFPPFIQEYIYRNSWKELREVQMQAASVIFSSGDNLLLSSATASGKTEAAFFPILADLCENPPSGGGVSVLYIAPLKSLINDQFGRMEELLDMSGIGVCHWHGDVAGSQKAKLLKNPQGLLQITPESLESLLMRRSNDIPRLFASLRYVVIDEVHTLIGTDRGNQIICEICRIERLLGFHARRIGLSATIGDLTAAAKWLGGGSNRETSAPTSTPTKLHWRLGMEHFYIQNSALDQSAASAKEGSATKKAMLDPGYEYLYDAVKDKKALVFSNSREETEYTTATLRQIAAKRGDKDVFLIHHGNLSAALREDAELKMKEESPLPVVTCATVTMELGIDIGRLERVAQLGAPTTVSGFLQRLGRSGRRNAPPEMMMVFREEMPLPNAPLPQLIPWELLRAIAIVELYSKERFIEPPHTRRLPLSLAYHQTLSILASSGELTPKQLAERVLSLPPFSEMSREDYRALLIAMLQNDDLEQTEQKGLIIGLRGERLISSYKFFAVFKDSEDYTVRCRSDEIGTITNPPPVGDRFALAGRVWEVTELDMPRRLVYVKGVEGKMEVSWPGDSGEIHTRLLEKMREILFGKEEFPYLLPNAKERLATARRVAAATEMKRSMLLPLGGSSWVLFPWLGTRPFRTLKRLLVHEASRFGISDIQSEGCCYITFKGKGELRGKLLPALGALLADDPPSPLSLIASSECPVFDKYDDYIPAELLRKSYAIDRLSMEEVIERFTEGAG